MATVKVEVNVTPGQSSQPEASQVSRVHSPSPPKRAKAIDSNVDYYAANGKKCGMALIFNHYKFDDPSAKNREGTDKDCNDIRHVLHSLNFDVHVHNDLTHLEIMTKMRNLASKDHTHNDCIVIVVMTHGVGMELSARDISYPDNDLYETVAGDKCKSLIGKPKIFFIQACRGQKFGHPVEVDTNNVFIDQPPSSNIVRNFIPHMADFLVMFSSIEGYVSFRDANKGTCFIQELCKVLLENGRNHHLLTLLTMVARNIAYNYEGWYGMKQIPSTMTTLTKKMRFIEKN